MYYLSFMSNNKNEAKKTLKAKAIKKRQIHDTDNGSVESQVAVLTVEINQLVEHLKKNPKDFSSRRGLLKKVGNRKSLLRYLASEDDVRYKKTIAANSLRMV